jgi:hypothetical protein
MIDLKQSEDVGYFSYLCILITNVAEVNVTVNPGLPWQKWHPRRRRLFSPANWNPLKCCICSLALYGAETWTLRKADKK